MAFIPSRIKRHKTALVLSLNLTSMMDMFTIILVFLIKSYSTEGQLISPSNFLKLPYSQVQQPPEVGLDVFVSKQMIMVNHEPVALLADVMKNDPAVMDHGVIKPLREKLLTTSNHAKKLEVDYGIKFSGKVTIQGDRDLPYSELVKVIRTCGLSNYPNLRLVVYRESE
ncbi:MAG: biopolymer transporter ExbD [candidate division KSB1 bacterium]|nr:biopolymer transporter ExbD [candidate division KSB1 bacterium]MDZ7305235.1 biopolymer transporter ExbD [candidate division KSB1 bacterium]MDZ7311502.1 biopolymer transporter ExbD [candidate division KSB1 bacterium]